GYIQYYGFIIPAIYINWIQVNGAIIGNLYNVPEWDSSAQNFLEELFPDYDVILLFTPEVNISGGGIHCITNDQPQQTAVSIEDKTPIPMEVTLHPAYPNPFNPSTTLRYDLPEKTTVNIIIYDMLGRQVKTVVNTTQEAGFKSVIWDATNSQGKPVSAGVYFYQIQVGEFVQTRKMVLLK
ncbi:MAG: agmatine deiminase family protein, partial [Candidatus Marinimicrobia bacterium]|nr:agmatine deiminase family protein [Candidatus Neomarinimicrobiota bacterium]